MAGRKMTDHFLERMAGPKWKDPFDLAFDERRRKKMADQDRKCPTLKHS
jgi:hypothetical protein